MKIKTPLIFLRAQVEKSSIMVSRRHYTYHFFVCDNRSVGRVHGASEVASQREAHSGLRPRRVKGNFWRLFTHLQLPDCTSLSRRPLKKCENKNTLNFSTSSSRKVVNNGVSKTLHLPFVYATTAPWTRPTERAKGNF